MVMNKTCSSAKIILIRQRWAGLYDKYDWSDLFICISADATNIDVSNTFRQSFTFFFFILEVLLVIVLLYCKYSFIRLIP